LSGFRVLKVNNRKTSFTTPELQCNKPSALNNTTYLNTYRRSTILRWKLLDHRFCQLKSLPTMEGGLHHLKIPPFSLEKNHSLIFEQFYRFSTQDLAGFSFALFSLPIAPCARAHHSLPAFARSFLLAPSLPNRFCAKKQIRKACGGGSDITSQPTERHSFVLKSIVI